MNAQIPVSLGTGAETLTSIPQVWGIPSIFLLSKQMLESPRLH